jgi:hypothetical protein
MGLHLCYELAVPRDTPIAEVVERMQRLYREAVTLPFETVGPLVRVTAGETLGNASEADSSLAHWFRFCARIGLDPPDPVTGARADRLPDAVGADHPGDVATTSRAEERNGLIHATLISIACEARILRRSFANARQTASLSTCVNHRRTHARSSTSSAKS